VSLSSGIISVFAGVPSGSPGSYVNGPASSAHFNGPHGIAVDIDNSLYVTDYFNNCIRKIAGGIVTTVAGICGHLGYGGDGGPATLAHFDNPLGIALDERSNIYIADSQNGIVRKILASNGHILTIAGIPNSNGFSGDGGQATLAHLNVPAGLAYFDGCLYIAESGNNVIRRLVLSTGVISTYAGNPNGSPGYIDGPATSGALFHQPYMLTIDEYGNLYVSDCTNAAIRRIARSTGFVSTIAGNGTAGFAGDGGLATAAELSYLSSGTAFDAAGNMYIADRGNSQRLVTALFDLFRLICRV
jgi:NHL repeat